MTEHIFNNLAYARLKETVTAAATTFYLYPGGAAPFLPGWVSSKEMYLTLTDASSNIEIVKVTAINGDILTVERGQDSSTAQIWYAGTIISQRLVAANLNQFVQKSGFRTIDYNPNGVLAAAYAGEKVFQTGGFSCNTRWWKHTTGTKWKLIAGDLCDWEGYDGDGYPQDNTVWEDKTSDSFWGDDPDYGWAHLYAGDIGDNFLDIAYGANRYVAITETQFKHCNSPIAGSWSQYSAPGVTIWYSIGFGNALFVAGDSQGNFAYGTDGLNWTVVAGDIATNPNRRIKYLNSVWVAVGGGSSGNGIQTSANGINWTQRAAVAGGGNSALFNDVIYDSTLGLYVAVGRYVSGSWRMDIQTSPDLVTWTRRNPSGGVATIGEINGIAALNGLLVIVGYDSSGDPVVETSTDGINWTSRSVASATDEITSITASATGFCLVGENGEIETSTDGINWVAHTADAAYGEYFFRVEYFADEDIFLAVGHDEEIQKAINCDQFYTGSQWTWNGTYWTYTGNHATSGVLYPIGSWKDLYRPHYISITFTCDLALALAIKDCQGVPAYIFDNDAGAAGTIISAGVYNMIFAGAIADNDLLRLDFSWTGGPPTLNILEIMFGET